MVSIAMTQPCCHTKAATENMWGSGHGCALIELQFHNPAVGWTWLSSQVCQSLVSTNNLKIYNYSCWRKQKRGIEWTLMNKRRKLILIDNYYMPGGVPSRVKQDRCLECSIEGGAQSQNPELTHTWCQALGVCFSPWPDLILTKATWKSCYSCHHPLYRWKIHSSDRLSD